MNFQTGFMQKPKGKPKGSRGPFKTIGVHIPTKEDLDFLEKECDIQYRSWSEYLYLLLRRERLASDKNGQSSAN